MDFIKRIFNRKPAKGAEASPDSNHSHQWELLLRTYCPPTPINSPSVISDDFQQKATFGFTTLLWECSVGRETRKEEILGTEPLYLDELVEKAEQFGPQYFQRNGSTYAIGKFQAQNTAVPLK